MKKTVFIFLILLISLNILCEETATVKRDRAIVRNGPGSFFETIAELSNGTEFTILKKENGWLQIQADDITGYVSGKVTEERQVQSDIFSMMGSKTASLRVSQHGMSAGVKGFAERFTKKFEGNPNFLETYLAFQMNVHDFRNFRQKTYQNFDRKNNLGKVDIPPYEGRNFFSFSEEGFGLGIASRISTIGLYENKEMQEYINQVGNIIVEASDAFDIQFKFFILDTDKTNAYACPGGIVFVTRGILDNIQTEAELAFVLAHEIAHVARHHGMIESEKRKHHIKSDDAFAELDEEIVHDVSDEETKKTEQEMEALSFEIFETIFQGRLEAYEEDADYIGMIYATRAGYDSRQILNLLHRLAQKNTESTNEHYTHKQIEKRLILIEQNFQTISYPENLFDFRSRWENKKISFK